MNRAPRVAAEALRRVAGARASRPRARSELRALKGHMVQAEKLASLGQIAAGHGARAEQPADVDRRLHRLSPSAHAASGGRRPRRRRTYSAHRGIGESHASLHARSRLLRPSLERGAGARCPAHGDQPCARVLRARAVGGGGLGRLRVRSARELRARDAGAARAGLRQPRHQRVPRDGSSAGSTGAFLACELVERRCT